MAGLPSSRRALIWTQYAWFRTQRAAGRTPIGQNANIQVIDGPLATLTITRGQVDDADGGHRAAQPPHKRQPQSLISAGHNRDPGHARLRNRWMRTAVTATPCSPEDFQLRSIVEIMPGDLLDLMVIAVAAAGAVRFVPGRRHDSPSPGRILGVAVRPVC